MKITIQSASFKNIQARIIGTAWSVPFPKKRKKEREEKEGGAEEEG